MGMTFNENDSIETRKRPARAFAIFITCEKQVWGMTVKVCMRLNLSQVPTSLDAKQRVPHFPLTNIDQYAF